MPGNTSTPTSVPQRGPATCAQRSMPARRAASLAIALAAVASLAACGSSSSSSSSGGAGKPLDVARVEKSIELSILSQKHIHATVSCPTVEQRQGITFTCYATGSGTTHNGHPASFRTPFTVEQTNNNGYVVYHS